MDTHTAAANLTDKELLREWEGVDCDTLTDDTRTNALALELEKRQLDN